MNNMLRKLNSLLNLLIFKIVIKMSTKKEDRRNSKELKSLNENLYDEFYVQKLEKRLETDPLLLNGFFGSVNNHPISENGFCSPICGEFNCLIY